MTDTLLIVIVVLLVLLVIGLALTILWRIFAAFERRISTLEALSQKRWTHDQLEQIETIQFALGRYLVEHQTAESILQNVYNRLGQFNAEGPDGKHKGLWSKRKKQ